MTEPGACGQGFFFLLLDSNSYTPQEQPCDTQLQCSLNLLTILTLSWGWAHVELNDNCPGVRLWADIYRTTRILSTRDTQTGT